MEHFQNSLQVNKSVRSDPGLLEDRQACLFSSEEIENQKTQRTIPEKPLSNTLVMTDSDSPSCQTFRPLSTFDGGENTEPILGPRLCLGCLQNECLWLPGNCLGAPAVSSGASPELLRLSSLVGCLLSFFALTMLSSSGTHSIVSDSLWSYEL